MRYLLSIGVIALSTCLASAVSASKHGFKSNNERRNLNSVCGEEVKKYCGEEMAELMDNIKSTNIIEIFSSISKVTHCLLENADSISLKCFPGEEKVDAEISKELLSYASTKNSLSLKGTDECQDIVNKLCGKEMTNLEKLLLSGASPKQIVKGARDLITCLINHEDEIGDKCDDMRFIVRVDSALPKESNCKREVYTNCGSALDNLENAINNDDVIAISHLSLVASSCITEKMDTLESACNKEEEEEEIGPMDYLVFPETKIEESRCHKGLYDMCGDELAALRKAIKHTSPNGIVGGALEVAGCVTINFVRLVKACSPFEKAEQVPVPLSNMVYNNMEQNAPENENDFHFDFYQCVEMAKRMIVEQKEMTMQDFEDHHHSHHGSFHHPHGPYHHDWHHHPHGSIAHLVAFIVMIALFVKGYKCATGRSVCFWKSKCQSEKCCTQVVHSPNEKQTESKCEAPLLKETQVTNLA